MRRPNLRIIGVDENEDFQLKEPANIFNKIIEENFPNLKKERRTLLKSYKFLNKNRKKQPNRYK